MADETKEKNHDQDEHDKKDNLKEEQKDKKDDKNEERSEKKHDENKEKSHHVSERAHGGAEDKSFPEGTLALAVVAIFAVLAAGWLFFSNKNKPKVVSSDKAKEISEKFIKDVLIAGTGMKVEIKDVKEENGLYKLSVNLDGKRDLTSYLSKDGEIFYPEAYNIKEEQDKAEKAKNDAAGAGADVNNTKPVEVAKEIPKKDKPEVQVFVMSYCPYGLQIEKGIVPVMETLKNKADIKVKFVDYAMHGEKEVKENLLQYCVQKEDSAKFVEYLKCFYKEGKTDDCLKSAGVNKVKIDSCVKSTDEKFGVSAGLNDKNKWKGSFPPFDVEKEENTKYGVQGSPTLVINGVTSKAGRDAASLLKAVCDSFTNRPKECDAQLSSAQPAPGFGEGTAAGAPAANCGN